MGVVCRKDHVSLRVGCLLRSAALRCPSIDIDTVPSTRALRTRRKPLSQKDTNRRSALSRCPHQEPTYFATVQGALFSIPRSFFAQMPVETRQKLMHAPGIGESHERPIVLPGLSIPQLRLLLSAFTVYPTIDVKRLTLDQALSIAEWAYNLGFADLKTWSVEAMQSLFILTEDSPLRTAPNDTFLRAIYLAILYRRPDISSSIQAKWLTRILWRELSPIPAILFADKYDFRNLLNHACYAYAADIAPQLARPGGPGQFLSSTSSPLNRRQRTHILAGYNSLCTYWKRLRLSPPSFSKPSNCHLHEQCCAAWKMQWTIACSRPCTIPDTDVLRRLHYVEGLLREDILLKVCLGAECRSMALDAISKKRGEISSHLHHHFDLS